MQVWCALAVILGATAGCDEVIGLDERPGIEITVTDLRLIGTVPTTDEVREVRATVRGGANEIQAYDLTATAGTLVPAGGEAELDDTGQVEITSMYRATTRGPVTIAAMVGDASATLRFDVFERLTLGLETGPNSVSAGMNRFYGARINLGRAGELSSIGLATNVTGTSMGKLAVYTNSNNRPAIKVAEIAGAQSIGNGRNEFPTPATMLAPGDYWIVAIFDRSTDLRSAINATANYGYAAGTFAEPMPTVEPNLWGTSAGSQLAFYVVVLAP